MAKNSAFNVDIDVAGLQSLADRLGTLDAESLGSAALRAVNSIADETYELARPRMIDSINLSDDYVQKRMRVEHATSPDNATATIIASGRRPDMTILARYGARQMTQPAKHMSQSRGDKLYSRNIAPGMKSAGISVEVTRSSRKTIANGFFMPLRNGNGVGLFTREGPGKKNYKHRYGPSVYQLFRVTAENMVGEVSENLETRLLDEVDRELNKAFK
ncbi:neck protein of type 1 [Curvibacter phage PCA1]|nr:neck protein of type 1 [Curvibacter phage PCA1]